MGCTVALGVSPGMAPILGVLVSISVPSLIIVEVHPPLHQIAIWHVSCLLLPVSIDSGGEYMLLNSQGVHNISGPDLLVDPPSLF